MLYLNFIQAVRHFNSTVSYHYQNISLTHKLVGTCFNSCPLFYELLPQCSSCLKVLSAVIIKIWTLSYVHPVWKHCQLSLSKHFPNMILLNMLVGTCFNTCSCSMNFYHNVSSCLGKFEWCIFCLASWPLLYNNYIIIK